MGVSFSFRWLSSKDTLVPVDGRDRPAARSGLDRPLPSLGGLAGRSTVRHAEFVARGIARKRRGHSLGLSGFRTVRRAFQVTRQETGNIVFFGDPRRGGGG